MYKFNSNILGHARTVGRYQNIFRRYTWKMGGTGAELNSIFAQGGRAPHASSASWLPQYITEYKPPEYKPPEYKPMGLFILGKRWTLNVEWRCWGWQWVRSLIHSELPIVVWVGVLMFKKEINEIESFPFKSYHNFNIFYRESLPRGV